MTNTVTLNITDMAFNTTFAEMDKTIIDGGFYEGEYVTVRIDGNEYTRKVYFSRTDGDLYITIKGYRFYGMEFDYE